MASRMDKAAGRSLYGPSLCGGARMGWVTTLKHIDWRGIWQEFLAGIDRMPPDRDWIPAYFRDRYSCDAAKHLKETETAASPPRPRAPSGSSSAPEHPQALRQRGQPVCLELEELASEPEAHRGR